MSTDASTPSSGMNIELGAESRGPLAGGRGGTRGHTPVILAPTIAHGTRRFFEKLRGRATDYSTEVTWALEIRSFEPSLTCAWL